MSEFPGFVGTLGVGDTSPTTIALISAAAVVAGAVVGSVGAIRAARTSADNEVCRARVEARIRYGERLEQAYVDWTEAQAAQIGFILAAIRKPQTVSHDLMEPGGKWLEMRTQIDRTTMALVIMEKEPSFRARIQEVVGIAQKTGSDKNQIGADALEQQIRRWREELSEFVKSLTKTHPVLKASPF